MKNRLHRTLLSSLATLFILAANAMQLPLSLPEPSIFADTEATGATEIALERNSLLTVAVSFEASPTNSVILAFGRDSSLDGTLGWNEAAFKIGWDAGEWVVSSPITGEMLTAPPCTPLAGKAMTLAIHVRADGTASSLEVRENGEQLFSNALALLPRAVRLDLWNCIRCTVRGLPVEILAIVGVHRDGTMLIMR
ncbi:MAG: hypothetical protein IJT64_03500 [Kiritimatiellae bacterium]|nr:hypothetical protein [Kiritimatiellia bacterium]